MHSYLITGGSYENRKTKESELCAGWHTDPHDVFRLDPDEDKPSIGIEGVRLLTKNLALSPRYSPSIVGVIDQSEKLTQEAQNALLKILEEPPPKARIIMETVTESVLLPTITSRCQIIRSLSQLTATEDEKTKILDCLNDFQQKTPGEASFLVTQLFDKKEEGREFLNKALIVLHDMLRISLSGEAQSASAPWHTHRVIRILKRAIQAQKFLSAHVWHSLVLDNFFQTIRVDKE